MALRCTTKLWSWRLLCPSTAPIYSSGPFPASRLFSLQRLGGDAFSRAGLWGAVLIGKTGLGPGQEEPAGATGMSSVLGEEVDATCKSRSTGTRFCSWVLGSAVRCMSCGSELQR